MTLFLRYVLRIVALGGTLPAGWLADPFDMKIAKLDETLKGLEGA